MGSRDENRQAGRQAQFDGAVHYGREAGQHELDAAGRIASRGGRLRD